MAFDKTKFEKYKQAALQKLQQQKSSQDIQNEPGLQDVSLTPLTSPDIQKGGEQAAEAIGSKGYPLTGATVGTAIQMAPDIAMASLPAGEAETLAKPVQAVADVALAPTIKMGGQALGAAEKEAGALIEKLDPKDLPTTVQKAVDLGNQMVDIAKHGPEDLAEIMPPESLNYLRKIVSYGLDNMSNEIPGVTRAALGKAKQVLTDALDIAAPELKDPRDAVANAYKRSNILEKIPGISKFVGNTTRKSGIIKGL